MREIARDLLDLALGWLIPRIRPDHGFVLVMLLGGLWGWIEVCTLLSRPEPFHSPPSGLAPAKR